MADEQKPIQKIEGASKITCPKCGHTFWQSFKEKAKEAVEAVGNAIGEVKFGG